MSGETVPSLPDDFGTLRRGRYTVLSGGARPHGIRACGAPKRILRDRPQVVAVELPARWKPLSAGRRSACPQISVIFYADEQSERPAPSMSRSSPADPFTEAIRTRSRSARRSSSSIRTSASARIFPTPIPTPTRFVTSPSTSMWKPIASIRRQRSEQLARHADGIAWKLQGADPAGARDGGGFAEPARSGARRHGAPQAAPMARRRREGIAVCQSASRIAWPK